MSSRSIIRWPLVASLVGHAAVVGAFIAYDQMRPEPPPKPVEIVMTAIPTTMDALSMKAEDAEPTPPEAAQEVPPVESAQPVPVEAARPVPVETVKPAEVAEAPPPPPEEVKTAKADEIPLEKPVEPVAEVEPVETKPVEERVEQVAMDPTPPKPKPRRPAPPRREPAPVAAPKPAAPTAPVADTSPPPTPAPPAQTAMLSAPAPAPRPARPAGPSQSYLAALRAQLERHKTYPAVAQRRRMEGTTTVRFTIARNGTVLGHRIVNSSGHSVLDHEVEELLGRASPLPPLPADVEEERLEIVVPISFYLR